MTNKPSLDGIRPALPLINRTIGLLQAKELLSLSESR